MTDNPTTPAGWYPDPSGVAELRYWDGVRWTEHVSTGGAMATSPLDGSGPTATETATATATERATATVSGRASASTPANRFVVLRHDQARTAAESSLQVTGPGGAFGRFEPRVDGAPGYVLVSTTGDPLLRIRKPGLKNAVTVDRGDDHAVGTITKVGRLHSRYDVAGPQGEPQASLKVITSSDDGWELRKADGAVGGTIARRVTTPANSGHLAGVRYDVAVAAADEDFLALVLALPVAIDVLDTQAT